MICLSKKRMAFATAVCASILLFASWALARDFTDMTGRAVEVPDAVNTVYASSPPETMLVYAVDPTLLVGLNFPLKGDSKYVDPHYLGLPVIGGYFGQGKTPNLEKLVAVKPDVVIGRASNPMREKLETFLDKFHIPVANIVIDRMDQYPAAFEFLGNVLNREGPRQGTRRIHPEDPGHCKGEGGFDPREEAGEGLLRGGQRRPAYRGRLLDPRRVDPPGRGRQRARQRRPDPVRQGKGDHGNGARLPARGHLRGAARVL